MSASSASASSNGAPGAPQAQAKPPLRTGEKVLVCGVNWIGDSVMTMPALQAFRKAHPSAHLALLVKPVLLPLWKLHAAPDEVLALEEGPAGTLRTVRALRRQSFSKAFVLPHSFRSAFIPWLARVPVRAGMPGHWRDAMLTQVVAPREQPGRRHQAYEYLDLMAPDADLELPALRLPEASVAAARNRLAGLPSPRIALIPGAARGPSKQWPAEHFIELGRRLADDPGGGLVVLGITREAALCAQVAAGIGASAMNLAGRTSLAEWIALLKACQLVVANDSGGMHLAAAVGTPVVALYGMTDPAKTGPLGRTCRVLQVSDQRSRDIPRESAEARESLAAVTPERVYRAVLECLDGSPRATGERK